MKQLGVTSADQGAGKRWAVIGSCSYFRPTARMIVPSLISAAWSFFFNHWATSRQIDKFDRWSGGPAVPHNSVAACLASSRSCLRATCGVVAWRLSQSKKSSSTIANCEPLIGSTWSSLMIWSSPDLSASRTTAAALSLLTLRRWRISAMPAPRLHLVEQAYISDCNHGLIGESLQERDLALGERSGISTSNCDRPDRIAFVQQRHRQNASISHCSGETSSLRAIGLISLDIWYFHDRAAQYRTAGRRVLTGRHWHHAAKGVQSFGA